MHVLLRLYNSIGRWKGLLNDASRDDELFVFLRTFDRFLFSRL